MFSCFLFTSGLRPERHFFFLSLEVTIETSLPTNPFFCPQFLPYNEKVKQKKKKNSIGAKRVARLNFFNMVFFLDAKDGSILLTT